MHELVSQLETLLFVSPTFVPLTRISQLLNVSNSQVLILLDELEQDLNHRGIRLVRHHQSYHLVSAPENNSIARKIAAETKTELTPAALETLAIVAYNQPVSKDQIEDLRGVASDQSIKNLLNKGLITEVKNQNKPYGLTKYITTEQFLKSLGLTDLSKLPPLTATKYQPALDHDKNDQ